MASAWLNRGAVRRRGGPSARSWIAPRNLRISCRRCYILRALPQRRSLHAPQFATRIGDREGGMGRHASESLPRGAVGGEAGLDVPRPCQKPPRDAAEVATIARAAEECHHCPSPALGGSSCFTTAVPCPPSSRRLARRLAKGCLSVRAQRSARTCAQKAVKIFWRPRERSTMPSTRCSSLPRQRY